MDTTRIITGAILGLISLLCLIYVSFTARGKGPIFSNSYIWASQQEREKINKKAEYKLLTIIVSGLAVMFSFLAIYTFTESMLALIVVVLSVVFVIIYAIVDTVRCSKQ